MVGVNQALFGVIALPLILIHGYSNDASVWDEWVTWLNASGLTDVYPITFKHDDRCGTVADHGTELAGIVEKILADTGQDQVNIVAHSKGGLDARWYIANGGGADKVANLVMIGTPNSGTPAAYMEVTPCMFESMAGREDLLPDSKATQVDDNKNTNYYTVAGDYAVPCFIVIERHTCYQESNDGFVTVKSVQANYTSLGVFNTNHAGLLTDRGVYEKVLPILKGDKLR